MFERYVNFEFYKTPSRASLTPLPFERYVNFEFYKTLKVEQELFTGLRDM